ncbi:MAG: dihydrolipoyl dehydrogenase [Pseudooceanicola nanhaiensis]|uniref:dihydrolipoyl dehydrogenase n=1 Tax=Pseudooceanicola nanhaiensis TaxID=375761 RepID=UPI00405A34C7
MAKECDVAVIGAGTAGLAAERKARACGAATVLIDPEFSGTTCATVGCMPSKLLIAAAGVAHGVAGAGEFGIRASHSIDGAAVMQRVRRFRDEFAQGVQDQIADLPNGVARRGRARFTAPGELELDNGERIRAKAVVLATGSAPSLPGPFRDLGDLVLTNRDVFELEDLPESLGVIGAGPIGSELAQAFARLGVRVEVFDRGETLAGLPPESSAHLRRLLEREMALHLGVDPKVEARGSEVQVSIDGHSARFERLLVATGRPPQLDGLDLQAAGIRVEKGGMPHVDPQTLQVGTTAVFLVGDANGDRPLLHEASDEGAIAGHNAAHFPELSIARRKLPMAVTFTRPSAAVIGTIPDGRDDLVTGCADYADQGRARVEGRAGGLLRLHAQKATGRLVGADLCIPDGEHIAHLLAWTISRGTSVSDALNLPFYHPTTEEGIKPALRELCAKIDRVPAWDEDEGNPPGH